MIDGVKGVLGRKACRFHHETRWVYIVSASPQHICQLNHRPLKTTVPEA